MADEFSIEIPLKVILQGVVMCDCMEDGNAIITVMKEKGNRVKLVRLEFTVFGDHFLKCAEQIDYDLEDLKSAMLQTQLIQRIASFIRSWQAARSDGSSCIDANCPTIPAGGDLHAQGSGNGGHKL